MRLTFKRQSFGTACSSFTAIAGFLLLGGVAVPSLLLDGSAGSFDLTEGLFTFQLALATVYLVSAFFLIKRFWNSPPRSLLRALAIPLLLVFLAFASCLWSELPAVAFRRAASLSGTVVFSAFLTSVLGIRKTVELFLVSLFIAVWMSFLFGIFRPDLGIHGSGPHLGNWKGAFLHKNLLGREMALGLTVIAVAISTERHRLWLRAALVLLAGLAAALLIFSGSATAIVVGSAGIFTVISLSLWHGRPYLRVASLILIAASSIALLAQIAIDAGAVFQPLGRDASLTGRTHLWAEVASAISERPFQGAGYGTFWNTERGAQVSKDLGWRVTHAHNGLLDVVLSLGVVGLILVGTIFAVPLLRVKRFRRTFSTLQMRLYFSVAVVTAMTGISDSVILGPNNTFFMLLLIIYMDAAQSHSRAVSFKHNDTIALHPDNRRALTRFYGS